jgi:hypothetical protein
MNGYMPADVIYEWSKEKMIEVTLAKPDDFLKVKETLTRIGISSKKEKKLFITCHILHKRGKYYIVHFKELFLLDGKEANFTLEDVARRNKIIALLQEWKLLSVMDNATITNQSTMSAIKIVPYREKKDWELISKYQLGKKEEPRNRSKYAGLPEENEDDRGY